MSKSAVYSPHFYYISLLATSPVSTKSSSPLHARSPVDIKPSPVKTPAAPTIQYAQAAAAHAQRMRTESGTGSTQSTHDRNDQGRHEVYGVRFMIKILTEL